MTDHPSLALRGFLYVSLLALCPLACTPLGGSRLGAATDMVEHFEKRTPRYDVSVRIQWRPTASGWECTRRRVEARRMPGTHRGGTPSFARVIDLGCDGFDHVYTRDVSLDEAVIAAELTELFYQTAPVSRHGYFLPRGAL